MGHVRAPGWNTPTSCEEADGGTDLGSLSEGFLPSLPPAPMIARAPIWFTPTSFLAADGNTDLVNQSRANLLRATQTPWSEHLFDL